MYDDNERFGRTLPPTLDDWQIWRSRLEQLKRELGQRSSRTVTTMPQQQSREQPREQSREQPREQSREQPREQPREQFREQGREPSREPIRAARSTEEPQQRVLAPVRSRRPSPVPNGETKSGLDRFKQRYGGWEQR
jgi:hypothetical protein